MECDVRTFKLLRARIPTHLVPIGSAYLDSLFGTQKFLLDEASKPGAANCPLYSPATADLIIASVCARRVCRRNDRSVLCDYRPIETPLVRTSPENELLGRKKRRSVPFPWTPRRPIRGVPADGMH